MKSFSETTKTELCKFKNESIYGDLCEFAGLAFFGGSVLKNGIKFVTENKDVAKRYITLCKKLKIESEPERTTENGRFISVFTNKSDIDKKTEGLNSLLSDNENRTAYARGAFLGGGTVIDPNKNYNLEIVSGSEELSRDFTKMMAEQSFVFKFAKRKTKSVIYMKTGDMIADFLSYIGAYQAQMNLINIKIEKEIYNDFNRSVNGENANFDKTVKASVDHIRAIDLIDRKIGLENLPDDLYEIARIRKENELLSLTELGKKLYPPLGKSGVNRRLKKIMTLAEKIK